MKKLIILFTAMVMFLPAKVKADEGMWFLMFIERLNYRDMQKMGLQLTPEEIYSINNNSLKDAIVQFDGGCTAEIISDQGLVLTNHHCGYERIAQLSTPEDDILTNGFWAKKKSEERYAEGLSVRFFVRMDDVTERILSKLNDQMSELDRERVINQEIAKIQQENNEGGKYTVSVKSFFQGNEFYYFVYQDFTDVRLTGTPPNSIGKYGGDTDNWEWPRHTGDFSMFRVYTDKDGNPAPYAEDNIPMKPKHHLPVNINGVKAGDFSMILGYPGRTNRWMPAEGVQQNVDFAYPAWVEGSKLGMDVMKKYMDKNDKVRLDYASTYAGVANYWKNRQGMIESLTEHKTAATKRKNEAAFNEWANRKENKAKYGNVMQNINDYYAATNEKSRHDNYLMTTLRTANMAVIPYQFGTALVNYAQANEAFRANIRENIEAAVEEVYANLYMPLEQEMLAKQLHLYATKSGYAIAPFVAQIGEENNYDYSQVIANGFENSVFTSPEKLKAFLDNPDAAKIESDVLFKISSDLLTKYREEPEDLKEKSENFQKAYRLFVDGLRKANPEHKYYPDANSTLRLTYGTVRDLPRRTDRPNDASANWFTTLKGTIAKHVPGDEEFDAPQKLIDLYNKKDYGQYADMDGSLHVNFLTDHDITGGNSGSPVLNGKGELIGLAFDGNIEAMAGDVIFDPALQRTINVDIRYVLFVIDKFAGATNLIEELDIVE